MDQLFHVLLSDLFYTQQAEKVTILRIKSGQIIKLCRFFDMDHINFCIILYIL